MLEAERCHVGKGELAQVTQALSHQESDDRPAHQEADGEDQTVETAGHHSCGNTQERCGRHVVAGNGQTVLEASDAATAGIEVRGRLGLGSGPFGDEQREDHKAGKHANRHPVGGLLDRLTQVRTSGKSAGRHREQRDQRECAFSCIFHAHFSTALLMAAVRSSYSLLARRT